MALESLYPKVEMGDGQTSHLSVGQLRRGGGGGENYFDGKKIYTYICYHFKQRKQRLAGKALTVLACTLTKPKV